jgi:hypothetical protein
MFFFFSNRLGCLGSLLLSAVVTIALLFMFGMLHFWTGKSSMHLVEILSRSTTTAEAQARQDRAWRNPPVRSHDGNARRVVVAQLPASVGAGVPAEWDRRPRVDRNLALTEAATKDIDQLFRDLAKSPFRQRFRLRSEELRYLERKGLNAVLADATDLVSKRLGAAKPRNDGKQTPLRGHPVFIAQHATATCCRGCLAKWHGVGEGQGLRPAELTHVTAVIERWLRKQAPGIPEAPAQGQLL